MKPIIRTTWVTPLLFEVPFLKRFRSLCPIVLGLLIFTAACIPLIVSGQYDLILSRPLISGFIGCSYVLFCAYVIIPVYSRGFLFIKYAITQQDIRRAHAIKRATLRYMNNDAWFLIFFSVTLGTTLVWFVLAFFYILDPKLFGFFYVLDAYWYTNNFGRIHRLIALCIMVAASTAILCAALWFQVLHWLMFRKLLGLRLNASPIMIYLGYGKLWMTTNVASATLLSGNLVLFNLVGFKPHPVQLLAAFIVTLPGTLGLLYPNFKLYAILTKKKESRARELLMAARSKFAPLPQPDRLLAYSGVYSDLSSEKNVGNMQAALSFFLGIVSLLMSLVQIVGLDAYTKVFGSNPI